MKLRISCRRPSDGPLARCADSSDAAVYVVRDDGTEEKLPHVVAGSWSVKAGEAAVVKLTLHNVDVDVEGQSVGQTPEEANRIGDALESVSALCESNRKLRDALEAAGLDPYPDRR